jgi:hypothetical protein
MSTGVSWGYSISMMTSPDRIRAWGSTVVVRVGPQREDVGVAIKRDMHNRSVAGDIHRTAGIWNGAPEVVPRDVDLDRPRLVHVPVVAPERGHLDGVAVGQSIGPDTDVRLEHVLLRSRFDLLDHVAAAPLEVVTEEAAPKESVVSGHGPSNVPTAKDILRARKRGRYGRPRWGRTSDGPDIHPGAVG